MRRVGIVLVVALAGCGAGGLEGTLQWARPPSVSGRSVRGTLENTTSHSVSLDAKRMRLLNGDGKKVAGRIRVARSELGAGDSTSIQAVWKSGNPVRIDYGSGTLALPSS